MRCNNCKRKIKNGSKFCEHCGAKIDPVQNNTGDSGRTALIILAVILSLAVVVAVGIIIHISVDKSKTTTTQNISMTETTSAASSTTAATSAKTTKPKTTSQTTTEKKTTEKVKTIGRAYCDIIDAYEEKYGYYSKTSPYVTGVCWYSTIDFDADGTGELFIVYHTDQNSGENFKYEVWTYKSGKAEKLATRKVRTGDYDTSRTIFFYTENKTSRVYLYEVDDYGYEETYGTLWTKSGNKYEEAYVLRLTEDFYRLDKDFIDTESFEEDYEFSTIEIPGEDLEYNLSYEKKIISKMG